MNFVISVFAATLLVACVSAMDEPDYSMTFTGEGTYYGGGPYTGNCAIRAPLPAGVYAGRLPVAINDKQYDGACGACVRIKGAGVGSGADPITGVIEGYISDRCPECKHGDLDLTGGKDGRWDIEWEFVPCTPSKYIEFLFEDYNNFYWKFQPRGMASPAKKCTVDGKEAKFTQDNHWEISMDDKTEAKVVVTTVMGDVIQSYVKAAKGVAVKGGMIKKSMDSPKTTSIPTAMPTTMPTTMPTAMPATITTTMPTTIPTMEPRVMATENPEPKPTSMPMAPTEMEPSMEPEATPEIEFDSVPLKAIRVFVDGKSVQELYDGEFAEIELNGSEYVTFECFTGGKSVGHVYFDINGELAWTETSMPYVLGGNKGAKYYAWKEPIIGEEFKLSAAIWMNSRRYSVVVNITLKK